MKNFFATCLCMVLLLGVKGWAQESYTEKEGFEGKNLKTMHADADWFKMMNSAAPNLFEVQKAYDAYFSVNPFVKSKETRAFEFWKKHVVRDNYDANGNVGKPNLNFDDLKKIQNPKSGMKKVAAATTAANWTRIPIKPDMVAPWQSASYAQGTCNMLAIHPTDTTQMIAAFIDGGTLWRTTDNCVTWTQVATNILCRHFGAVVYCKSNPQIVYAGSSQGVIKSTDGGATWAITGYNNIAAYPGGTEIWAMEVKADDPNTVLFGLGGTMYRTTDGGSTWATTSLGSNIRDIRALPSNNNVVLATVKNGSWVQVLRSTNFGSTWTSITNGYPASLSGYTGELATMAVSPAAPNNVWVHLMCRETATGTAKTYDIYKSTDGGLSFSRMNVTTDISENFWQGGWNEAFGVSDTDPNLMASGSYSTFVSRDGGVTWSGNGSMGKTGPHSDVHGIVIRGKTVWSIGDGGFYKSYDYGANYDHSVDDGIQSHCLWGFDQAWKSDIMALGMYHGPTTYRDDAIYTGWYPAGGADAGVAFVNKGDDRYIYAAPWGLARYTRSTSRTVGPTSIGISAIYRGKNDMNDPNYYEKVYGMDGSKVMISTNNASSFDKKSSFQSNISDYLVAFTDNKTIYCRTGNTIMKTTDGGINWTDVSPTSIRAGQNISHMAIDGNNPSIIWVTFGGKQTTIKVGKSTDGGTTWTNYSGTVLPSYSVNCIVNQMGTNGDVYIGTDAGVYYRNNSLTDWTPYNSNLPLATHVGWIKINYAKAKIRIAGQTGIWESNLNSSSSPIAHPTTPSFLAQVNKNIQFTDMSVALANATYSWSFPDGTPSTSTLEKPIVTYATGGDKNVTLTVTDVNGTSTKTYDNFIRVRTVGDISKTGWIVKYYDNQNSTSEAATNTIDGNKSTIWHTAWSGNPGYPHDLQIDMGSVVAIESFKYLPRQDGSSNGNVKGYEWYISNDGTNWGTAVASGEYSSGSSEKISTLPTPLSARYFRFRPLSEINGQGYASAAEVGIVGSTSVISAFTANKTLTTPGNTITFTDKSAGNPTSWSWSFPGGTPSTSTGQNPTITYNNSGIYPVTLTVSSANGTDIITKESYITVSNFVPQTGWTVKYVDSQETSGEQAPATNAFDGNINTYWHTQWSGTSPAYPHTLLVDMGANYFVNGFNYIPRQNSANGRIANYQFYVGTDTLNMELTNSGTWTNDANEKSHDFTARTARYFKLVALSEINNNAWASAAELKMKLCGAVTPVADFNTSSTTITTGQTISFTDLSTNTPTSWSWNFAGGTPATSTNQNPSVTYSTAGTYSVSLTAANAAGNNTMTKSSYITVTAPVTYCTISSSNYTNDYIKTAKFDSYTKSSTGSYYSDYTSEIIPLTLGASTSYTLTPKGTTRTEYWKVYIDYNHDGTFSSSELVISTSGKTSKTGTFTVSASALTGQTRMRVIMKYSSAPTDACTSFTYGEIEDYTVNISTGAQAVITNVDNTTEESVTIYLYQNEIIVSNENRYKGEISIYDTMGRLIESKELTNGINAIPAPHPGMYIVKVKANNETISRRVITR